MEKKKRGREREREGGRERETERERQRERETERERERCWNRWHAETLKKYKFIGMTDRNQFIGMTDRIRTHPPTMPTPRGCRIEGGRRLRLRLQGKNGRKEERLE